MRRHLFLLIALLPLIGMLAPDAEARLGGGHSFGSRGTRTYMAPPATRLAPNSAQPFAAPPSSNGYRYQNFGGAGAMGGSFFSRHPLATGFLGGLIGAGIGGMLFGGGFFHPGLGFGGLFGMILQLLILFFVVRFLFRLFAGRRAAAPAFAGGNARGFAPPGGGGGMPGGSGWGGIASGMGQGGNGMAPLQLTQADRQAFEQCFVYVQQAWDAGDVSAIGRAATPEMMATFNDQLASLRRQGLRNRVTDIRVESMETAEAWTESGMDYATVAIRFSMLDATMDAQGRVVDGSTTTRSLATELWTFLRARGSHWTLSAIQQSL